MTQPTKSEDALSPLGANGHRCRIEHGSNAAPSPSGTVKLCAKCELFFPLSYFYKNKGNRLGANTYCKACTDEEIRKSGEKFPQKQSARRMLKCAVNRGKINKPNQCSSCLTILEKRKIHGHHHDYSKPLDVTWLCSACHYREHDEKHTRPYKVLNTFDKIMTFIMPEPMSGCWPWIGNRHKAGYGKIGVDKKWYLAHRYIYAKMVREIPKTIHLTQI